MYTQVYIIGQNDRHVIGIHFVFLLVYVPTKERRGGGILATVMKAVIDQIPSILAERWSTAFVLLQRRNESVNQSMKADLACVGNRSIRMDYSCLWTLFSID